MRSRRMETNDLHALTAEFPPSYFVAPGDVHFTPEGSARIAAQVADTIARALSRVPVKEPALAR